VTLFDDDNTNYYGEITLSGGTIRVNANNNALGKNAFVRGLLNINNSVNFMFTGRPQHQQGDPLQPGHHAQSPEQHGDWCWHLQRHAVLRQQQHGGAELQRAGTLPASARSA